MNRYGTMPASALAGGDLEDAKPEAMDEFMMGRYRGAAEHTDGAKLLREEPLQVAGATVACYVMTVFPNGKSAAYTWWIDIRLHHHQTQRTAARRTLPI